MLSPLAVIVKVKEEGKISFFPPTVAVMKHHCWIRKPTNVIVGLETFVCPTPTHPEKKKKKQWRNFRHHQPCQSLLGV